MNQSIALSIATHELDDRVKDKKPSKSCKGSPIEYLHKIFDGSKKIVRMDKINVRSQRLICQIATQNDYQPITNQTGSNLVGFEYVGFNADNVKIPEDPALWRQVTDMPYHKVLSMMVGNDDTQKERAKDIYHLYQYFLNKKTPIAKRLGRI